MNPIHYFTLPNCFVNSILRCLQSFHLLVHVAYPSVFFTTLLEDCNHAINPKTHCTQKQV